MTGGRLLLCEEWLSVNRIVPSGQAIPLSPVSFRPRLSWPRRCERATSEQYGVTAREVARGKRGNS